ncbi:extracellular solute-binding protein [soil metagenome]
MKKLVLLVVLSVFLGSAALAQTEVRWFVGLGAGSDEPTFAAQEKIVEEFNASQSDIKLVLEIVDSDQSQDVLATQISAGNAPDLVGPVGIGGRAAFPGAWMDLSPFIEANNYDLSDFDPALVDFYKLEGEGQLGIPFAVFPSFITYNKDLFDEAGLPYPPSEYGAPYMDENGDEQEWTVDTLRDLAMKLTVDANGVDATSEDFDPNNIVQWGFGYMFTDLRGRFTLFGPGNFVDADGNAIIPVNWQTAAHWYQDAMWKDNFYPNGPYGGSALLGDGNWFDSGNLAMAETHLWYLSCCLTSLQADWDVAPVPTYNGEATAKLHADTFGILKSAKHPEEAFTVLSYLLSPEVAGRLASIYGGMPARISLQDSYFEQYATEKFPDQDVNWDVVAAGLSHPDTPNHEEGMPSSREARDRYNAFTQRLENEPDFEVDAELELLKSDLQRIFDANRN